MTIITDLRDDEITTVWSRSDTPIAEQQGDDDATDTSDADTTDADDDASDADADSTDSDADTTDS